MAARFHEKEDESIVVVFDFGGGTLDISLLIVTKGVINVESTAGDMFCGGRDLDDLLAKECIKIFCEQTGINVDSIITKENGKFIKLLLECEKAKIALNSGQEV